MFAVLEPWKMRFQMVGAVMTKLDVNSDKTLMYGFSVDPS